MLKRWVTKYALTTGVVKVEGKFGSDKKYFYSDQGWAMIQYGPKDHHDTREQAVARAEEMRQAKIKSLQKQLDRINKLEF